MKIGLIREGKVPADKRVPFSPSQCRLIMKRFNVDVCVQSSQVRAFSDQEYHQEGVKVQDELYDCDLIMGVKEVPVEMLIPEKTYLFFSHTLKKQPHNRKLLKAILDKKIRLIDYEAMRDSDGVRLVGFGRYAGIVGAYNAFRGWGKMTGHYHLIPAHQCHDQKEMETYLPKVQLPPYFKIVVTGDGRVAGGVLEVLHAMKIREVTAKEFLLQSFEEPVFTQLSVDQYNRKKDGSEFVKSEFYRDPSGYESYFGRFSRIADMLITAHFWASNAPYIYTAEMAASSQNNIKFVADISCDTNGPIAPTLRASTIEHPFYGYDPNKCREVAFGAPESIGVMAIDNLPCELPRDASEGFGRELINNVLPYLLDEDPEHIIAKATETERGELTQYFQYLHEYVASE